MEMILAHGGLDGGVNPLFVLFGALLVMGVGLALFLRSPPTDEGPELHGVDSDERVLDKERALSSRRRVE